MMVVFRFDVGALKARGSVGNIERDYRSWIWSLKSY